MVSEISVIELYYMNYANIIDIRSAYDYSNGHIDGAINIPYYNLTYIVIQGNKAKRFQKG